jgi:hypothetical protein
MSCEPNKEYTIEYDVGSKVYIKKKAKKGIIEYVYIKKYQINGTPPGAIVYLDAHNRVWMERELIPQSQAIELALSYWNARMDELSSKAKIACRCSFSTSAVVSN